MKRIIKQATAFVLGAAMALNARVDMQLVVKAQENSVFSVVAGEEFGSHKLEKPLIDNSKGSYDVTGLVVPYMAYDDSSISIVWNKPENYSKVADYNIYIDGVLAGTARDNFKKNAEWAAKYMEAFYDYYNKTDFDMVDVDIHAYKATGLKPDTEYEFGVVAVDKNGTELGEIQTLKSKTAKTNVSLNVVDYGAKATTGYTSYNDEINSVIESNTKAIQKAINECPSGGTVVIPKTNDGKVFVSGAIWLKSDITLQIDGTLWASPNSDHFEIGFLMYPFYTDTRGWGLVNAMSVDESNPIKNVRVTGTGTIYGNGWKNGSGSTIKGDGVSTPYYYSETADVDTSKAGNEKYQLKRFVAGNNSKVYYLGVQAADSAKKYIANVTDASGNKKYSSSVIQKLEDYSNQKTSTMPSIDSTDLANAYSTRSSLVIMRNCENVYVGDVRVENPANHTINILDSKNVSANNLTIMSYDGNNGDGLGFGCSQNVICWGNFTDTGDDNINFAASVGNGAKDCNINSNSNIWVFDNYLHEGHGGLAAGSHTGNGIQDILFEDCVMNHIDMAFRFKSAPANGGYCANITMRDCAIADTQQAYVLTTSYSDAGTSSNYESADDVGQFYNFVSSNVSVYGVAYNTIQVLADVDSVAHPEKPWHTHHNLYFQDITFGNVGTNGSYKNKNGWETLIGCENAVFYNFKTLSYASAAVSKNTNKAWNNIQYCKNIQFQGTTLEKASNGTIPTDKLNKIMSEISINDDKVTAQELSSSAKDRTVKLSWSEVKNGGEPVFYGIETYVDGNMVDKVEGIKNTYANVERLSSGVEYEFRVYASEYGDNANSMTTTALNRTLLGTTKLKTQGQLDNALINPSTSVKTTLSNSVYTHAQAVWSNISKLDKRVRGYKFYVNDKLVKTVYNYQLAGYDSASTFSNQIGRLAMGTNNKVVVKAFTDAGVEYAYPASYIKTLERYDFKSPVFAEDAQIVAKENAAGEVELSWSAATDDTEVLGYRVYVDGVAIGDDNKAFNPVNGSYTTNKTEYIVKNIDLSKPHTFTVQAGDTWWKAATTMGSYDKMAGFNWTVKGISTSEVKRFGSADGLIGDVDNNGVVNSSDAVLLKQWLAGYDLTTFYENNADVNKDGTIDSKDAVLLMQKLAGYEVGF